MMNKQKQIAASQLKELSMNTPAVIYMCMLDLKPYCNLFPTNARVFFYLDYCIFKQ